MKKRYLILSILVFLSLILVGLNFNAKKLLASPILGVSKIRLADNLWQPTPANSNFQDAPEISATSAFFVETNSGEVLYEKEPTLKLPIASLTKIMTAIMTLENKDFDDQIEISQSAANMEPDKMLLIAGEKLSVKELLEGIFLVSANDASEALAEEVTGNREEFISLMNLKARQLGMKNTFFINPSGLDEDTREQYSTAYDVALMSRYAVKEYPSLVDISSKEHIFIPLTETHQDYDLYTGINLISSYPGVVGFKTGFTPSAGLTLVTLARRGDKEVLGVLLSSNNRREDAKALLDYSFSKLGLN